MISLIVSLNVSLKPACLHYWHPSSIIIDLIVKSLCFYSRNNGNNLSIVLYSFLLVDFLMLSSQKSSDY